MSILGRTQGIEYEGPAYVVMGSHPRFKVHQVGKAVVHFDGDGPFLYATCGADLNSRRGRFSLNPPSGRGLCPDCAFPERRALRFRAHALTTKAIANGRLVRPNNCSECGREGGLGRGGQAIIQAHHDNYAHPLSVRWLCSSCHGQWHASNTPAGLPAGVAV